MASLGVYKLACVGLKKDDLTKGQYDGLSVGQTKLAWVQGVDFLEEQVFPFL